MPRSFVFRFARGLAVLVGTACALPAAEPVADVIDRYCIDCHDSATKKGGLLLEGLDPAHPGAESDTWERVVRQLNLRQMPPVGEARPDDATYDLVVSKLVPPLDRAAAEHPNPGRTDTLRRLNRTEYQNA